MPPNKESMVYWIHFTLMPAHEYPTPWVTTQKNLLTVGIVTGTSQTEVRLTNHLASRIGGGLSKGKIHNALWTSARIYSLPTTRWEHAQRVVHIRDIWKDAHNVLSVCTTRWEHSQNVYNPLRALQMPITRWRHSFRSQSEFGFGS